MATESNPRRLLPTESDQIVAVSTPTAPLLLLVVGLLAVLLTVPQRPPTKQARAAEVGSPQLTPAAPRKPISFRDRLVTGLKARLKSEIAFVDNVVTRVNAGQLPRRLVDETFFWARQRTLNPRRNGRQRRPIIYFQPAMAARAARLGVTL